ncbi:GGDEF domain-containing protein [Paraconexibacter antarcticus]|uniref:GGDEF domain-containing protein n=1 Tax=Paraconexibacter antarcticus TaxID=2949664 RepID=A0ABY5DZR9_9ACTN|nr:GGDEF domain-containing protein [Paraconexibacter antarcticus]UTI66449.1 GGDEF domain-containing protein [Paraconexibacter antarcticus]
MPDRSTPHGRRPRPVAGLPAVDGVAVAKGWLLELLARTPLHAVARIPAALLAREAPDLCVAVAAAVASDAALERLATGDGAVLAARAGALTGATASADVVAGIDALRSVLHRALRTEEDAALAADTGDRLAHVCALVTGLALGAGASAATEPEPEPERAPDPAPPRHTAPRLVPPEPAGRVVVAQDLRADAPHREALDRALAEAGHHPVTALAIEIDDRERLAALEDGGDLLPVLAPLEDALVAGGEPDDVLVREQPGRWWLIAPRTGTDAARVLAGRLSGIVGAHAPVRHGVPLTASIGVAVFPDDGADADALLEHADQGVFTARALGVPIA